MIRLTTSFTPAALLRWRGNLRVERRDRNAAPDRIRHVAAAGFTLIELLTVITIIGIMAGILGYALRDRGTDSFGLQTAQQTVGSLLTLARSQAAVSGRDAGVFVHSDPDNPDRYLRFLVPLVKNEADTDWVQLSEGLYLPQGCYVLPQNAPSGAAVETGASWSTINSSALQTVISKDFDFGADEEYRGTVINPRGTTGTSGEIIVGTGRPSAPGSDPPFVFTNPDNVRGVRLSTYGQATFLNNPSDLTAP